MKNKDQIFGSKQKVVTEIKRCIRAAVALTQLSTTDGEVPVQDDPLLDALSVGRCLLVDSVDAVLDGGVDRPVPASCDLRDACGVAAEPLAEVHGLRGQLVLWITCVRVHLALHTRFYLLNCAFIYAVFMQFNRSLLSF